MQQPASTPFQSDIRAGKEFPIDSIDTRDGVTNSDTSLVVINHVENLSTRLVKKSGIDLPQPGASSDIHAFHLGGWLAKTFWPIEAIDVMWNRRQLRRIAMTNNRFDSHVGTLGLPPQFELNLHAVKSGATQSEATPFAVLRGQRQPLRCDNDNEAQSGLQPLLVTGLGRSGTTWLMRLLMQQPEIVLFPKYPYESRLAVHSMQTLRVLLEPANTKQCPRRDVTTTDILQNIGANPYYDFPETQNVALRQFFGAQQPEEFARFYRRYLRQWYHAMAANQGQNEVRYFAEKAVPNHVPWLMREVFPALREVILVRDYRDMIASALAFNERRGFVSFGRNRVKSDAEYVLFVKQRVTELQSSWYQRLHQTHFLRYEDLIAQPHSTLQNLLQYLQLDASPERIASTLESAQQDTPELKYHRTSASPQDSLGRWKRDLSPKLQRLCERELGPILSEFGYEV